MTLNETVIDFYIQHSFVNIISIILNNESISESAKSYLINSLYTIYMDSSTSKKNKLLDLYVKYKMLLIIKRILNDDNITYSQIKKVCNALSDYKDDTLDEWLHREFLDFNFILNPDFIPSHIARSTYILINTPLDEISDPTTINSLNFTQPFIDSIISNYDYYSDHDKDWLNQLVENYDSLSTLVNLLWANGIRLTDSNLKFLDNVATNVSLNVDLVKAIKKNFSDYIRCECLKIIQDLYINDKLTYNEFRKIDLDGSDEMLDILVENYQHANSSNYANSLLNKVNLFELARIFMYMIDLNCLDQDEIDFFLSRPDCNQNLKILLLSNYTLDDLDNIDKETHYSFFIEVFKVVFYSTFIQEVITNNSSYSDEELSNIDSKYANEIVKCTTDSNLDILANFASEHGMSTVLGLVVVTGRLSKNTAISLDVDYARTIVNSVTEDNVSSVVEYCVSVPMYNVISLLIYEKSIPITVSSTFSSLDGVNEFNLALLNNIGNHHIKERSYKLLDYRCFSSFIYLLHKDILRNEYCYDFCFTKSSNYEDFMDYFVKYMIDSSNNGEFEYEFYTGYLPHHPTDKYSEIDFNNIKQDEFSTYSQYSQYSNAYDNYYHKLIYSNYHPNSKVRQSTIIYYNILAYLALNVYAYHESYIVDSNNQLKYKYFTRFARWIDQFYTVFSNDSNTTDYYNFIDRLNISCDILIGSDPTLRNLTSTIDKIIDSHSDNAYWSSGYTYETRSILKLIYDKCAVYSDIVGYKACLNKIIKFLDCAYAKYNPVDESTFNNDLLARRNYESIPFGVTDGSAYNIASDILQTVQWSQCIGNYYAMSYKIRNYSNSDPATSEAISYIKSNWRSLIPYITEGYRYIRINNTIGFPTNYSSLIEFIRNTTNSNNGASVDQFITDGYIDYTKWLITLYISSISESDLT